MWSRHAKPHACCATSATSQVLWLKSVSFFTSFSQNRQSLLAKLQGWVLVAVNCWNHTLLWRQTLHQVSHPQFCNCMLLFLWCFTLTALVSWIRNTRHEYKLSPAHTVCSLGLISSVLSLLKTIKPVEFGLRLLKWISQTILKKIKK